MVVDVIGSHSLYLNFSGLGLSCASFSSSVDVFRQLQGKVGCGYIQKVHVATVCTSSCIVEM